MINPAIELRQTEDGTYTLYNSEIDECYHSQHGALQESNYIFIESAFKTSLLNDISVFEVGFGTGLNACLTLKAAEERQCHVRYTAIELFPLDKNLILQLDRITDSLSFTKVHACEWGVPVCISPMFTLKKVHHSLLNYTHTDCYDVVYFDAFSPEKQPEMWDEEIFKSLFDAMNEGGILITYCAKGEVRRRLQRCGFLVERLPGPPGKRHILRATKTV